MSSQSTNFRAQRRRRIRAKIQGTKDRPRLVVFRSNRFIYAQLIDDEKGRILLAADDQKERKAKQTKTQRAEAVGKKIAELAGQKKIKSVVFDRAGYRYHGRVKALADGARAGGLKF